MVNLISTVHAVEQVIKCLACVGDGGMLVVLCLDLACFLLEVLSKSRQVKCTICEGAFHLLVFCVGPVPTSSIVSTVILASADRIMDFIRDLPLLSCHGHMHRHL